MTATAAAQAATVGQWLRLTTQRLTATSPSAKRDAELLLGHVLQAPRGRLLAFPEQTLTPDQISALEMLIERRREGEPVAYLTGQQEFWSLPLQVTADVLVPRPETELIVELVLALPQKPQQILDLGTGSGALALAIASELPDAQVLAIDQSLAALAVAEGNARRLQIANVAFETGDWLSGCGNARFDLIVSNPPYIAEGDAHLQGDGVRHEPRAALASGVDGLDALRRIIADAPAHLQPGGRLLLEHGADQGAAVRALLQQAQLGEVRTHQDYAGLDRVSGARQAA